MNRAAVLKYTKRVPVRPFVLHLAEGQALHVRHPDFLTFGDDVVAVSFEDSSAHIVDLDQIVSIGYAIPSAKR